MHKNICAELIAFFRFLDYSPVRLAYKGFLSYLEAMAGLFPGVRSLGSPKYAHPRVWAGFPGLPSLAPRHKIKSQLLLAFSIVKKWSLAFWVVKKCSVQNPKVPKSQSPKVPKSQSSKVKSKSPKVIKFKSPNVPKSKSQKVEKVQKPKSPKVQKSKRPKVQQHMPSPKVPKSSHANV